MVIATPQGISTMATLCVPAAQNLSVVTAHSIVTLGAHPYCHHHTPPHLEPTPGCSAWDCLSNQLKPLQKSHKLRSEHVTPALLRQGCLDAPRTSEGCRCNLQLPMPGPCLSEAPSLVGDQLGTSKRHSWCTSKLKRKPQTAILPGPNHLELHRLQRVDSPPVPPR